MKVFSQYLAKKTPFWNNVFFIRHNLCHIERLFKIQFSRSEEDDMFNQNQFLVAKTLEIHPRYVTFMVIFFLHITDGPILKEVTIFERDGSTSFLASHMCLRTLVSRRGNISVYYLKTCRNLVKIYVIAMSLLWLIFSLILLGPRAVC